jgi:hypothetical protein
MQPDSGKIYRQKSAQYEHVPKIQIKIIILPYQAATNEGRALSSWTPSRYDRKDRHEWQTGNIDKSEADINIIILYKKA